MGLEQYVRKFWMQKILKKIRPLANTVKFPVAQMVEHGASNTKIMGSIPRESKRWENVKNCNLNAM